MSTVRNRGNLDRFRQPVDTFKLNIHSMLAWGYDDGQALIECTDDCRVCKQPATKRTPEANII